MVKSGILRKRVKSTLLAGQQFLPTGQRLAGYAVLSLGAWIAEPHTGAGQQPDSLMGLTNPRPVYPVFRPLLIQSSLLPGREVESTYQNDRIGKARALPGNQLRVTAATPVLRNKRIVVMAGVNYLFETGGYDHLSSGTAASDVASRYYRQDIALTTSAMHQDSLFGRPVTYLASLTATGRNLSGIEKLTGGFTTMFAFRNTPTTRLSAGFNLQLDPSAKIPLLPVVSYWHRFAQSEWELDIVLPSRFYVRRPVLAKKGWLSVGSEVVSTHSFGAGAVMGLGNTYEATTASVQGGAMLEYPVLPSFMLGLRAGIDKPMAMHAAKKNSTEYLLEGTGKPAPYVGMTMSLLMPTRK